jgi:ribosomal protein S18 acetylase RimI-like enzyme
MTTETTIREAGISEIGVLSSIVRDSFRDVAGRFGLTPENCPKHPSNCTDDWIEKDFARGVSYYILEKNHAVIGCGALERVDPKLCYLERLAVLPQHRHRGYGRALVDHIMKQAILYGAKCMSIGIIADDVQLKQWYLDIGFVEGETKEFSHLPFLVTFMKCDL